MSEEIVSVEDVDLEDIYRVEVEAWGDDLSASKSTIKERLNTHAEGFVGVKNENELVGYLYGIRYDHDEVDPRTWEEATDLDLHDPESDQMYITTVGVSEDHRGQGYGTKLLQGLEERAREIGVQEIYLGRRDTKGNKKFYESNGYDEVEKIEGWWPEDGSSKGHGVMMKKEV